MWSTSGMEYYNQAGEAGCPAAAPAERAGVTEESFPAQAGQDSAQEEAPRMSVWGQTSQKGPSQVKAWRQD